MKKKLIAALAVCLVMVLMGCTEADKVNYNMSQQASYFESERRITVYNARTITSCISILSSLFL